MIFDSKDTALDALAAQCLRVRELIDTVGDPLMRAAIDLLLLEVARALAQNGPQDRASGARGRRRQSDTGTAGVP